jgi:hypothetical protein
MRPKIIRISPYAATDPNGVSLSQTPAAGGIQELTITGALAAGGVATMDVPRQVLLTFAGDESSRKFIVTGANGKGNHMAEAIAGTATTAQTVQAFTTVTSIQIDADSAGAIQAGTASVVSSNWLPLDYLMGDFQIAMGFDVGAAASTPDFTVELTLSNILRQQGNLADKPRILSEFDRIFPPHTVFSHSTMVNMAADTTGNLDFPVRAIRLKSNGVFITGGVSLEVIQGGLI